MELEYNQLASPNAVMEADSDNECLPKPLGGKWIETFIMDESSRTTPEHTN